MHTVPQVKSKTICCSSLTYILAVLNSLHQGEWPLQASHTIMTVPQVIVTSGTVFIEL